MKGRGQRLLFYGLNILLPLLCGLLVYLRFRPRAYVSIFLGQLLSLPPGIRTPEGPAALVSGFLPDVLWAWALCFAATAALGWQQRERRAALTVCLLFAALTELLQKTGVFPGTFDWMDILAESAAAVLAAVTIHLFEERYYEKIRKHPVPDPGPGPVRLHGPGLRQRLVKNR